ncbi:MAG: hypothetical protein H7Z13_16890 [Ferruginibacter sp.]|nr:hypothetical protein [Ferruginibacter sp.]
MKMRKFENGSIPARDNTSKKWEFIVSLLPSAMSALVRSTVTGFYRQFCPQVVNGIFSKIIVCLDNNYLFKSPVSAKICRLMYNAVIFTRN